MQVFFDVQQLYYLPQYTPLQKELEKNGVECTYVFYRDTELARQQALVASELGCQVRWVGSQSEAMSVYINEKPDWLIIGNFFDGLERLHPHTKSGLMSHGIGPKSCYYTVSDSNPTVRFVEGPYRTKRLQELYPKSQFVDVGYAKLDPIKSGELDSLTPRELGLDPKKPTLLYAPTFYPSSIERFSRKFPREFSEYNIIVKPHYFSLANKKYKKQRKRLELWSSESNVYLAGVDQVNILPYMAVADILISDASSTLFEFAALDKPVVWCDFYKLRAGYRGIFSYRFQKRMDEDLYKYADIAAHADSYESLRSVVDSQFENPNEYKDARRRYTEELAGLVDGCVSKRIAEYMLKA